jgi:hypothetical protein
MIQPQELRLGNWIVIGGKPAQVTCVSTEGVSADSNTTSYCFEKFEDIHPIALTAELLEKAGFENITPEYDNGIVHTFKKYLLIIRFTWDEDGTLFTARTASLENGMRNYSIILTSLHQLQNLYFALTGKELEINL